MIISNERSKYGKYATVQTETFGCVISTAPGLFKGSTLVMALKPDGSVDRMPLGKAYLKRSLSRADRDQFHDYIVHMLDELGGTKVDLSAAVEGTFSVAKARGLIVDYIKRGR
jgi:hypothetical protein